MVNPLYTKDVMKLAKERFKKERIVQLLHFLDEEYHAFQKLKWTHIYEPMKHSYRKAKAPKLSKAFRALLSVFGKIKSMECRAFQPGDYTVLYDKLKAGKGNVFFLDLNTCPEEWGGFTVFVSKDKDVFRIVPRQNALTIVNQAKLRQFTKYLNHHADHPRVFLYGQLQ